MKTTRRTIVQQELAALNGPVPFDEFAERILRQWHSAAKNPRQTLRTALRLEYQGHDFVFVDAKTIVPKHIARQGVRFRIRLGREEAKRGVLMAWPAFEHLRSRPPAEMSFVDERDQALLTQIVKAPITLNDSFMGRQTLEMDAFDLRDWFRAQRVRAQDDVLVTIVDWSAARYRLEHESANRRRKNAIEQQNRALADIFYALMEETYDERLPLYIGVPTAYARQPSARDYPGDHWLMLLEQDPRMRVTEFFIMPPDQHLPFEFLFTDEPEVVREQPFTRQEGQQVYRFGAGSRWRRREHTVEVQGNNTLWDFDRAIRKAFDLDPEDHLSEFTQIIPRGKGKKPREIHCGELNPFGKTPAAKVRVAGLKLKVGAQLLHVHDFGDWNEHYLMLESIQPPEGGATYPRLIAVKKS